MAQPSCQAPGLGAETGPGLPRPYAEWNEFYAAETYSNFVELLFMVRYSPLCSMSLATSPVQPVW